MCISILSMALYIAEIVTIVRHKKFYNSFYALFVMRAIPDWLGVLVSFYGNRLPSIFGAVLYPIYSQFPNWMLAFGLFLTVHTFLANNLVTAFILLNRLTAIIMPIKHEKLWRKFRPLITIFVYGVPTLLCWPVLKMDGILQLDDPNSTTDPSFAIYEAGDAPYIHYSLYISLLPQTETLSIILNENCGFMHWQHFWVTCSWQAYFCNLDGPKTKALLFVYYPLIMDTGTVMLASWLLLWASDTIRQQLIKDFSIIQKTNIQNNRVGPLEGPGNNTHRPQFRTTIATNFIIRTKLRIAVSVFFGNESLTA
uniref:Serpentine receptor class gamma n=1 Tax=Globodera rostochiensis TaxID=31243 RepID=A0A914HT04_GLORO